MATAVKARKSPYRTLLLKKREELLSRVKSEPEALATSLRTPDDVEFAVKNFEQDLAAQTVELHSRTLKEVDRALARVAAGTYGVCEGCGRDIPSHRLKAIPWARYCLICQELRSRN